jgi:D-alanine-D-alanine ligase
MERIKVGIVYGGKSPEHQVSKMTAKSILKNINREKFDVVEIFIDRNGNFDEELLKNIDIVFLAVHGENYEDGKFQRYLDNIGVKYTGSGARASEINMNKDLQKKCFQEAGLDVVSYFVISINENLDKVALKIDGEFGYPCIIKPINTGSSLGITKVSDPSKLLPALLSAGELNEKIIIEKAIEDHRELEVSILGNSDLIVSDPGEVLTGGEVYSYEEKYFTPFETTMDVTNLSLETIEKIKNWAEKAYRVTDCWGYARVDFFLAKNGDLYINEINTLPGFTSISMFPKALGAMGITYKDLITRIIELGLE